MVATYSGGQERMNTSACQSEYTFRSEYTCTIHRSTHTNKCTLTHTRTHTHIKKLLLGIAGELLQVEILCRMVLVLRLCAHEWTGDWCSRGRTLVLAMESTYFFHR